MKRIVNGALCVVFFIVMFLGLPWLNQKNKPEDAYMTALESICTPGRLRKMKEQNPEQNKMVVDLSGVTINDKSGLKKKIETFCNKNKLQFELGSISDAYEKAPQEREKLLETQFFMHFSDNLVSKKVIDTSVDLLYDLTKKAGGNPYVMELSGAVWKITSLGCCDVVEAY